MKNSRVLCIALMIVYSSVSLSGCGQTSVVTVRTVETVTNRSEVTVDRNARSVQDDEVSSVVKENTEVLTIESSEMVSDENDGVVEAVGSSKREKELGELLCDRTQARPFGSIRVQIYANGDVYADEGIEEPNHKWKMEYYKTLSDEDLDKLKGLLECDDKELSTFIDKLIK